MLAGNHMAFFRKVALLRTFFLGFVIMEGKKNWNVIADIAANGSRHFEFGRGIGNKKDQLHFMWIMPKP